MLVLRMPVSPALPSSPTTTVDIATRPGVQVLEGRGGGVIDGGLEARRRVPDGQDEAIPFAQVPRPHARRGGAPRDQLQEHRAAQRIRDAVGLFGQNGHFRSPFASWSRWQRLFAVERCSRDDGLRLQPDPEPLQQAQGEFRHLQRGAVRLQDPPFRGDLAWAPRLQGGVRRLREEGPRVRPLQAGRGESPQGNCGFSGRRLRRVQQKNAQGQGGCGRCGQGEGSDPRHAAWGTARQGVRPASTCRALAGRAVVAANAHVVSARVTIAGQNEFFLGIPRSRENGGYITARQKGVLQSRGLHRGVDRGVCASGYAHDSFLSG
ncbi:unnamed protein product [Ectocarpus sp. 4 AP-2014]